MWRQTTILLNITARADLDKMPKFHAMLKADLKQSPSEYTSNSMCVASLSHIMYM